MYITCDRVTHYVITYLAAQFTCRYISDTEILVLSFTVYILQRTQARAEEILKSFKELMMKACTFIEAQIQRNMKEGNGFAVGNRVSLFRSFKTINSDFAIKKFDLIWHWRSFLLVFQLTFADIMIFEAFENILATNNKALEKCVGIMKCRSKVANMPRIKDYLSKRKCTSFWCNGGCDSTSSEIFLRFWWLLS